MAQYTEQGTQAKERRYFENELPYIDRLVLLSENHIATFPYKYDRRKLCAIPNAIPDEEFPQVVDWNAKEKVLLFCGRIVHNPKNILFLLYLWRNVYRAYPEWRLVLCGDGEDKDIVEEYIRKHRLERIEITGFTNPEAYYEKSRILLLPSYSESFGIVLLEGMAHGCVPIVFDTSPAFRDVIANGENGYIVDAIDRKAYISRCRELMEDGEAWLRLAKNGMERCRLFRMEAIGERWMKLFDELRVGNGGGIF